MEKLILGGLLLKGFIILICIFNFLISINSIFADDKIEDEIIIYRALLKQAREMGDKSSEGENLTNIARLYAGIRDYDKALDYYENALEIFMEIDDKSDMANTLNSIGGLYHYRDQYEDALKYYEKAYEIFRETGDKQGKGKSLNGIGSSYYELSLYNEALNYHEQALEIFKKIDDIRGVGRCLGSIGIIYIVQGDYDKALDYYEQRLEITREIGDIRGEGHILHNIGNTYSYLGQYDKALEFLKKSLEIRQETGDRNAVGSSFLSLGVLNFYLGQHRKALDYLEQSIEILREIGDRSTEGYSLSSIGAIYNYLGRYDKGLEYLEKALKIRRDTGHRRGEGNNLNNIGSLYNRLGRYDIALDYHKQAYEILKDIGIRQGEGNSLNHIGSIYYRFEEYEKALEYYDRALKIMREINYIRGEAGSLRSIGSVYHRLGHYDKAAGNHEQALDISREIGDIRGEANSLYNIALVYNSLGQYNKAISHYKDSIEILQRIELIEQLWQVQISLARGKASLNKLIKAADIFEQGLNNLEKVRTGIADLSFRDMYMDEKLSIYDEYIELLWKIHQENPNDNYNEKIFEIFERKKGRIFFEQIAGIRSSNYSGIPESVLEKENDIMNMINTLENRRIDEISKPERDLNRIALREIEKQISDLRSEQEKLKKRIKTDYPDYYQLKYPDTINLSTLQKDVLEEDEMILIYNISNDISILLLIGKEHFSLHHISSNNDDLSENIQQYLSLKIESSNMDLRGRIIYPEMTEMHETPRIYDMLFPKSVQIAIADIRNLFIIPTGPLYQLPFEALMKDDGNYLIETHSISYLSSASLLKILRETQDRRRRYPAHPLLAFANPVYAEPGSFMGISELRSETYRSFLGDAFTALPETEEEVMAIKEILQAPLETNPLQLREKASRSNVFQLNENNLLEQYRYIIFACHGILPGEINHILQPALVLSDPDPNTGSEGFLTMADILSLSLNADLITLSACNTGIGMEDKGDGIMGLSRAFMYAGTPAVNVNLWSVETMSAKALNVGFYQNLSKGKNLSDALRDIKLRMLKGDFGQRWKHPFYWAPMIIFGDGRIYRHHNISEKKIQKHSEIFIQQEQDHLK